jgi:excisionase family DNA binding protein
MPGSHEGRRVEPRFFTIEQVAAYLSVSPAQVYALVKTGELPAIKIATPGNRGVWRVDRNQLEEYIARLHEQTRAWTQSHSHSQADKNL